MFTKTAVKLIVIFGCLFGNLGLIAQGDFEYDDFPKDLQLYARDSNNEATVAVKGDVSSNTYASLNLKVFRNNTEVSSENDNLNGSNDSFNFEYDITAELANYKFELYGISNNGSSTLLKSAEDVVAGDVIIITGQSNAEAERASSFADDFENDYIRVYESGFNVASSQWYIGQGDGNRFTNGNTGGWGLKMASNIIDNQQIPVAVFNGSHGGADIDFFARNNSNPDDTASNYGKLLSRLEEADLVNDVKALIWYQGETDAGSISVEEYYDKWIDLFDGWEGDIPGIDYYYIHQIRVGCNRTSSQVLNVQEAHRQLANDLNDVQILSSKGIPLLSDACHYDFIEGYQLIGDRVYDLLNRDLYGNNASNIDTPQPAKIYKSGSSELTIEMVSNSNTSYNIESGATNYFAFSGGSSSVSSASFNGDDLILNMSSSVSNLTSMSYLGVSGGDITSPYIKNAKGIGMLSFKDFPICENSACDGSESEPDCTVGGSCNDGDPCTTGDVYDDDCNCSGTFADSDGDGVCNASDDCPGFDDALDSDNDGIPDGCDPTEDNNTGSDDAVLTGNTGGEPCVGPWVDSDNDGVCDAADICEGGDDYIDTNSNGIPDACDNGATGGDGDDAGSSDGVLTGNTGNEACPSPWLDTDGDGICNNADVCEGADDYLDSDNDGIPDGCEDDGTDDGGGDDGTDDGGGDDGTDDGGGDNPSVNNYCTSAGENTVYEYIQSVEFGSINNDSGNNGGYENFTSQSTSVSRGSSVDIEITPGFVGAGYNEIFKVWIDFNQDGDFFDSGEEVFSRTGSSMVSGTVNIPSSASTGDTRMRVSMRWNSAPNSCGDFSYGEVEDYTVSISNAINNDNPTFRRIETAPTLSLYPNPVVDELTIELKDLSQNAQLEMYNNIGQLIQTQVVSNGITTLNINTSQLQSGMYTIVLKIENELPIVQRFVKKH